MKRVLCTGFLALAPLALTACGGDNGVPITSFPTPTVTTQELTKTDYITRADAICSEANAALGSLPASDAATLAAQEVDITQNLVDQLKALGIPSEDQITLQQYLDAEQEILDNQKKVQLAQERGEASTAEFTTAIATAEAAAKTAAETYGFQECGTGATTAGAPAPGTATQAPATPAPTPAAPATPPTGGGGTGGGGNAGGGGGGSGNSGGVGAP
jgi:hypothetical protein